jgi:SEL1 protein
MGVHAEHEDGYYDDMDLDIDDSVLEGLLIVGLAATLLVLVYIRQQQQRNRQNANAANQGGNANGNANANANANANNNDRGFFPQPGDPEFGQWVAGGVGH